MSKLTENEIQARISVLPRWVLVENTIRREFELADFKVALSFVNKIGEQAEAAWHHPDIDIRWNKVIVVLTTHDSGGLTTKDFDLAEEFDRIRDQFS